MANLSMTPADVVTTLVNPDDCVSVPVVLESESPTMISTLCANGPVDCETLVVAVLISPTAVGTSTTLRRPPTIPEMATACMFLPEAAPAVEKKLAVIVAPDETAAAAGEAHISTSIVEPLETPVITL